MKGYQGGNLLAYKYSTGEENDKGIRIELQDIAHTLTACLKDNVIPYNKANVNKMRENAKHAIKKLDRLMRTTGMLTQEINIDLCVVDTNG